ncbi:hypothetical protein Syun_011160 [Stephania yunnanensis]|uniref:Uncharacterized protein n=1 Tax=Stephania yunnanensis TaxID=152371 RepID=A0AAP0PHX7_9MAGN
MNPIKKPHPCFLSHVPLSLHDFSPLSVSLLLSAFSPPRLSRSPSRLARALGLASAASRPPLPRHRRRRATSASRPPKPRERHCIATAAASRPPLQQFSNFSF